MTLSSAVLKVSSALLMSMLEEKIEPYNDMCKIFIKIRSDVDVCSTVSLTIMGFVNSFDN